MKIQPAWNSEMRDIWWYMYAFARFLLNCINKYTPALSSWWNASQVPSKFQGISVYCLKDMYIQ